MVCHLVPRDVAQSQAVNQWLVHVFDKELSDLVDSPVLEAAYFSQDHIIDHVERKLKEGQDQTLAQAGQDGQRDRR